MIKDTAIFILGVLVGIIWSGIAGIFQAMSYKEAKKLLEDK